MVGFVPTQQDPWVPNSDGEELTLPRSTRGCQVLMVGANLAQEHPWVPSFDGEGLTMSRSIYGC